jgi:hypothetical protein
LALICGGWVCLAGGILVNPLWQFRRLGQQFGNRGWLAEQIPGPRQLLQPALFSGPNREIQRGKWITRGIVLDETMLPKVRMVNYWHWCVSFLRW